MTEAGSFFQLSFKLLCCLLKAFGSLSNAAAYLRQLLGAENECCDAGHDDKLRHAETKQAGTGKTLLGSDSGLAPSHNQRLGVEKNWSQKKRRRGFAWVLELKRDRGRPPYSSSLLFLVSLLCLLTSIYLSRITQYDLEDTRLRIIPPRNPSSDTDVCAGIGSGQRLQLLAHSEQRLSFRSPHPGP